MGRMIRLANSGLPALASPYCKTISLCWDSSCNLTWILGLCAVPHFNTLKYCNVMDSSIITGVSDLGLVIAPKARTETRIGMKEKRRSKACLHLHLCYSANYNSTYGRLYYWLVE